MLVIEQFQNPELTLKDDVYTCALADKIISESQETDEWYEYFDDFASLLNQQKTLRESTMIIEAVLLMVILQFVREFSEWLLNPLFPETVFAERMITMLVMIVLSGAVVLYARLRNTPLSVFPKIVSGNITAAAWKLAAGLGYGTVPGMFVSKPKIVMPLCCFMEF